MDPRAATTPWKPAVALAATFLVIGCAQPGPLTSRRTTIGSLKSAVTRLEGEKDGLKRELADLKSENRRIRDELVQADAANGELAARLDDARNLIRHQGGDPSSLARPNDVDAPSRTIPAGRNTRKPRKSPLTQIPGVISVPDDEADDRFEDEPINLPRRREDDPGPQSRRDDGAPWAPVARGGTRSRAR